QPAIECPPFGRQQCLDLYIRAFEQIMVVLGMAAASTRRLHVVAPGGEHHTLARGKKRLEAHGCPRERLGYLPSNPTRPLDAPFSVVNELPPLCGSIPAARRISGATIAPHWRISSRPTTWRLWRKVRGS